MPTTKEQSTLPGLMMQEPLFLVIGLLAFITIAFGITSAVLYNKLQGTEVERCKNCPDKKCPPCGRTVCPSCPPVPKPGHDKPPVIELAETERRFTFPSGSAELSQVFALALTNEIIPQILRAKIEFGVNMVQAIGHTDQVSLRGRQSTLDADLIAFLQDTTGSVTVSAGSNTDLAMLRAASVMRALRSDARMKDFSIVAYSAGQALQRGDKLSTDTARASDPARRRVVIRLTKQ